MIYRFFIGKFMALTAPETLCKQPTESGKFSMEFANRLAVGETISSVDGIVANKIGGGASDILIGQITSSGTQVLFWIDGGTDGTRERLSITLTTSASAIKVGDGILKISTK